MVDSEVPEYQLSIPEVMKACDNVAGIIAKDLADTA